jgi:predicted secreted protein
MSDMVEVGEHENGQQIEMRRQQTLRVTLAEVRTAGFRWIPRPSTQRALLLLADELDPAAGGPGGAAKHHWDFLAKEAGTAEIAFDYCRPWARAATNAAARTFTVSVHVV